MEYDRVKGQEMKEKISSGMSISGGQNWFLRIKWIEGIRYWHWTLEQSSFWGMALEYVSEIRMN